MKNKIASPDPLLQFMFAMFAVMTCLSIFKTLTPDAIFVMGVFQVTLGIGTFVGSILNLQRGDPHGNINLILSVILGLAGGITQLASIYAKAEGYSYHPWLMSVFLFIGGLYMLCFLPLMNKGPLYVWTEHLSVVLGFFCTSLADLLSIAWLKPAGGVFLAIFAVLALYQGVSMMYMEYGKKIPQGPQTEFWKKS